MVASDHVLKVWWTLWRTVENLPSMGRRQGRN